MLFFTFQVFVTFLLAYFSLHFQEISFGDFGFIRLVLFFFIYFLLLMFFISLFFHFHLLFYFFVILLFFSFYLMNDRQYHFVYKGYIYYFFCFVELIYFKLLFFTFHFKFFLSTSSSFILLSVGKIQCFIISFVLWS